MAKLERVTAKVFASDAPADKIGQFGSALAGTKLETGDVSTIQALPAYTEGWSSAVISQRNYPVLQETNGVMKNMSYQTAYIMQNGIAEYDADTEYYTGSICKGAGTREIYMSLVDDNVGRALNNETFWANITPVLKTGDTMTGDLTVEKDTLPRIYIKNSGQDRSVAASTDAGTQYLYFTDKNDATMGSVGIERYTNGRNTIKLQAFSTDGSFAPAIRIAAKPDNTAQFTLSHNPPNTSNGLDIATTSFCDGNWIAKILVLESGATHSSTTQFSFSLADYLPNDSNLYEVKFYISGEASGLIQWNYTMGFNSEQLLFIKSNNYSSNIIGLANNKRTLTITPTSISKGSVKGNIVLTAYRKVR